MYAIGNSFFSKFNFSARAALAVLASMFLLSACGGGGDAGEVLPESVTISSLDGPSGVTVGTSTSFNVKVVTTGGIGDGDLTYTWEQTAGTPVLAKSQGNGNHESTLTFTPAVANEDVTFRVTVDGKGNTASQSKTVHVNP